MKRWIVALSVLLLAGAPLAAQGEIVLQGLGGDQLRESDLGQGAAIIVFWASWSPRGRDIAPRVSAIASSWGGRARVVTVNFQEDRGTIEAFLGGKSLGAPVFLDPNGAFSKKHAITTLPGLLVMKSGQVAYRGKLPDNPDQVLKELLN